MFNYSNLNSFSFSLTNYCGCKCKHCLMNANKENKNFFEKTTLINICKELISLGFSKNNPIALTGGELSFHPEIINIVREINDLGFKKINLSLTGMAFNEKIVSEIAPLINIASFSIDGPENFHNSFRGVNVYKKTLEIIKYFKKYNVKNIAIQMSIFKQNINFIDYVVDLANNIGANHVRLVPILPLGKAKKNIINLNLLSEKDYEMLLKYIIILNGYFSNIDFSSIIDRKNYLINHPEKIYGLESIKNFEINQNGDMFFNGLIDNNYCVGNINKFSIKSIIENLTSNPIYIKYNNLSKKIYNNKIINGTKNTICIYKEKICC